MPDDDDPDAMPGFRIWRHDLLFVMDDLSLESHKCPGKCTPAVARAEAMLVCPECGGEYGADLARVSDQRPARWPDWRPPSEFPRPGVSVIVTLVDHEDGDILVDMGERPTHGPWMLTGGDHLQDDEVVAWMPAPPPCSVGGLSTELSTKGADETGE